MFIKRILMMLAIMALLCTPAFASNGGQPNIELAISAYKKIVSIEEDGSKRVEWREVANTDPGDVLKYTIRYTNKGDAEAKGAVIVDPVPSGASYIGNTAEGEAAEITFSLDGKSFQSPPMLKYRIKGADGSEEEYMATPGMYSHIKWQLVKSVPPGGTGTVGFEVKVK